MQISPSLPNPAHRLMAEMQKGRYVLQGMAVCDGELNKLRAKVPYQRGRGTCDEHGSLIRLMLLTKQPVQQKGQPLFSLDLSVDDGGKANLGRPVLVLGALAVPRQGQLCIRGEIPKEHCSINKTVFPLQNGGMAAVPILTGRVDQTRLDRILHDVTDDAVELLVLGDQVTLVPSSIDGSDTVVALIVIQRIAAVQKPYKGSEGFLPHLEQQMVVIIHQDVLQQCRLIGGECCLKEGEKLLLVTVVLIDVGAVVTPLDDMLDGIRLYISLAPGHMFRGLRPGAICRH